MIIMIDKKKKDSGYIFPQGKHEHGVCVSWYLMKLQVLTDTWNQMWIYWSETDLETDLARYVGLMQLSLTLWNTKKNIHVYVNINKSPRD